MAGIENATPNDNDLHGDQNAAHWAERFASKFEVRYRDTRDGLDTNCLMLTWFAGALETGRMYQPTDPEILEELKGPPKDL